MTELSVRDTNGERHINGIIWYPTDQTTGAVRAQGNAVWEPIRVHPNAEPSAGQHPLVILSHSIYGSHQNLAWLASLLTQDGYVVAAIDHPGTTTFNRDPNHARELWKRPIDISRTIDHILETPAYSKHVDAGNIFMAGHSLGGLTAVALAGGRIDPVKIDTFCASNDADLACDALSQWNVGKTPADRVSLAADLSDDRIKGFAVFDLGGTQTFSTESLGAIKTPMLVYGAPENVHGMNLDIVSRTLAAALPAATSTYLEPTGLTHFDFMGTCKDQGLAILKDEEPDDVYVCEKGIEERAGEHKIIAAQVIDFFAGL